MCVSGASQPVPFRCLKRVSVVKRELMMKMRVPALWAAGVDSIIHTSHIWQMKCQHCLCSVCLYNLSTVTYHPEKRNTIYTKISSDWMTGIPASR